MDEERLIRQLQAGNEDGFREIVEKYLEGVVTLCRRIVHSPEDAEDVAQEVFIEIFRSIGRFRGDSKLSTWIYRIAMNKSLNHIRKLQHKRWMVSLGSLAGILRGSAMATAGDTLPSAPLEKQQKLRHLWKAIDSLPEKQRKAFILSRMEEFSYSEISEIMDTTIPAVESLLQRARINLQMKLWGFYKKEYL